MSEARLSQDQTFSSAERILHVLLNDIPVGTISLLQGDQNVFAFDDDYVTNPMRPTLSLSFKSATGQLITQVKPRRTKLHPFFSNLLPEGHLREYLAEKSGVNKEREFFLLSALRDDLPGAVRIRSEYPIEHTPEEFAVNDAINPDGPLRFSLAGVQLKFSAIREASGGLTIPVSGAGGDWIVKLPSSVFDALPEAEYSMMTLARASGIDVPQVMLLDTGEIEGLPSDLPATFGPSLAIKRFDRGPNGERIHAEDFAQIFGLYSGDKYGKASYENIAFVIWTEAGEAGLREFVKRLVFTVITGNADMHVKNWSLIYPNGMHARVSPAYDLVPTILFMPGDRNLGLSLGKTKNMYAVNTDTLRRFAANAGVPESLVLRAAKDAVNSILEVWSASKFELPLVPRQVQAVENHMATVPLTRELASRPRSMQMSEELALRTDNPDNWYVSGNVELDEKMEAGKIVFKTENGETFEMQAPARMVPWVLADQAANLAKRHPRLANTQITVLAGPQLFDEWRSENVIRFEQQNLETVITPRELEQAEITIVGKFFPRLWRKLEQAQADGNTTAFDIVFPNDELWTWNGKVLSLEETETLADGRKSASIKISIANAKYFMRVTK